MLTDFGSQELSQTSFFYWHLRIPEPVVPESSEQDLFNPQIELYIYVYKNIMETKDYDVII